MLVYYFIYIERLYLFALVLNNVRCFVVSSPYGRKMYDVRFFFKAVELQYVLQFTTLDIAG
jgi:hypothetical protein